LKVFKEIMTGLLIGAVAKLTGVSPPTIRYYEDIGLLAPPLRSPTGYRRYSDTTVEELRFVRKAQALGFSLDEIAEVLRLSRSGKTPCSHVLTVAHRHLTAIEERIRHLQTFRERLAAELAKWDGKETPTCRGLCQIIAEAEADDTPEDVKIHLNRSRRGRQRAGR
jgi:DNA-binding transcriptional MerR regulator